MKKKFLSLLLAICMILPCTFLLNACGGNKCEHDWQYSNGPTATDSGWLTCSKCPELFELPKLNETDYEVDDTNPDYVTYTYTKDNKSYTYNQTTFEFEQAQSVDGYVLSIVGYTGNCSHVVIPEKICGVFYRSGGVVPQYCEIPIVSIENGAFMNNTNIASVTLSNNIKSIGANAFNGCLNLTAIELPENVSGIGEYAFANTGLTEIVIPASCTLINGNAFENCNSLTSVYHMRSDKNEWFGYDKDRVFSNATQYYYSETQPTGLDYLNNDCLIDMWHYDESNNKVLWEVNFTEYVDNKSFTYSHSKVSLSDTYWAMLKEAENQGVLGDLFDNDQEQIEMVTSSATKAEYETKFATWYGTTMGTQSVVSFADGKITITLLGNSGQIDYIEVDGEIYDVAKKEKVFTFDTTDNSIYEERADEHSTIRHIYSIVE